ncbi:MAG: hypothetical protein Q7U04_12215, partial [Bacteriovorax sp.]|nr:hypothetical protein [Bacteriovorax sp.]
QGPETIKNLGALVFYLLGRSIGVPHLDACDSLISCNWAILIVFKALGSCPVETTRKASVAEIVINFPRSI